MAIDVRKHNREIWNRYVGERNRWTRPVDAETIARAREGDWQLILTPCRPVPRAWFPDLDGARVLCLASGGGQQGPILSAAGASVTVLDNSPRQLEQDRRVADREGLKLETVEGDMAELEHFDADSFDFIVHPVSNLFVEDVRPVWREAYRVLVSKGSMIAGFVNPVVYLFDRESESREIFQLKYSAPYSDLDSLSEEERAKQLGDTDALEFGHTLEDQLDGQLAVGFQLLGFYEDDWGGELAIDRYLKSFMATRVIKP